MPNHLLDEDLIPLSAASKLLPPRPTGKPVGLATLYRWAQRGVRGVRLETVPTPLGKMTSREALKRFLAARAAPATAPAPSLPRPSMADAYLAERLGTG